MSGDPRPDNPFAGVTDFFSELARIRSLGVRGGSVETPAAFERTHASAWVPATDILADGPDLLVRLELPGVDPDDVDLRLAHNVLTISGARRGEDDDAVFYVRERDFGEFRRVITLPDGTEPEHLVAEFDDGLVQIRVRDGARPTDSTRIALSDRSGPPRSRGVTGAD